MALSSRRRLALGILRKDFADFFISQHSGLTGVYYMQIQFVPPLQMFSGCRYFKKMNGKKRIINVYVWYLYNLYHCVCKPIATHSAEVKYLFRSIGRYILMIKKIYLINYKKFKSFLYSFLYKQNGKYPREICICKLKEKVETFSKLDRLSGKFADGGGRGCAVSDSAPSNNFKYNKLAAHENLNKIIKTYTQGVSVMRGDNSGDSYIAQNKEKSSYNHTRFFYQLSTILFCFLVNNVYLWNGLID